MLSAVHGPVVRETYRTGVVKVGGGAGHAAPKAWQHDNHERGAFVVHGVYNKAYDMVGWCAP